MSAIEQRAARIAELKAMMAKRRNQSGYAENVKHIETEIARLEAEEAASAD